ncbi:MAG: ABC transporter permease [Acidobacteria bacterium]|nr:ABC transporter permease [Acidobacteriota bacterium]
MRRGRLVVRSLRYYWRTNLAASLGIGTAVAVLAGALMVGDSVRASLRDLVVQRLGRVDLVVGANGFFRERLAADLKGDAAFAESFEAACPIITLEGLLSAAAGPRRVTRVQVYAVDECFWRLQDLEPPSIEQNAALVSRAAGEDVHARDGDAALLTIREPAEIPAASLHGRKDDRSRILRLTIRGIQPASEMGDFSIRPQQGDVRAVFLSLSYLQRQLDEPRRANTLLVSKTEVEASARIPAEASAEAPDSVQRLTAALRLAARIEDLGLRLRPLEDRRMIAVESTSGLVSDHLAQVVRAPAEAAGMRVVPIFTYLVNTIRSASAAIPYSLVTAIDEQGIGPSELVLNEWAAREMQVAPGERITLEYYVWEDTGRLVTRSADLRFARVVPMNDPLADRTLAPAFPGISDTEHLADWDPPFPLDLKRIRKPDEAYWDRYRTTPKAFVSLETGQRLWRSRHGALTSLRLEPSTPESLSAALAAERSRIAEAIGPVAAGFSIANARAQGLAASRGATDFGEYFTYFSFFLVVSALLLASLFFKLGVDQRAREVGLLGAVGLAPQAIARLFFLEGVVLSALGGVAGVAGAIGYAAFIMHGLRTWWVDASGTTLLTLHVSGQPLLLGIAGAVVAAVVSIWWTLRMMGRFSSRTLLVGAWQLEAAAPPGMSARHRWLAVGSSALALVGALAVWAAWQEWINRTLGFFGAGSLLLLAMVGLADIWLRRRLTSGLHGMGWLAVSRLGVRNATYRPARSVLCIVLIAAASFTIVAVSGFRRDLGSSATQSGTGGFPLVAETLVPIVSDPNSTEGRESLGLSDLEQELASATLVPFRVKPGDDASCLNLYEPRDPRIIAPPESFRRLGRFAFQDSLADTDADRANPWLLLDRPQPDGAIAAIADANSLAYVLHRRLGDEIVLHTGAQPVRLRLVAALDDSVFQSELVIGERDFLRLFPAYEGYRFFLIDAAAARAPRVADVLEDRLSDFGFDATSAAAKLAAFHRVENTYIATFQTLGALGLLLGTVGLGAVLVRNLLERRRELALLRAVGYNRAHFMTMTIAECGVLLAGGLGIGTAGALVAIAPAFLARGGASAGAAASGLLFVVAVLAAGLIVAVLASAIAWRSPLAATLRSE